MSDSARRRIRVLRDEEWRVCQACPLHENRHGARQQLDIAGGHALRGGERPYIMFVVAGQSNDIWRRGVDGAPSSQPWMTQAESAGVDFSRCLITTEVLCPTVDVEEAGSFRMKDYFTKAKAPEIASCSLRLTHEVHLAQPRLIVTLGQNALRSFAGPKSSGWFTHSMYQIVEVDNPGNIVDYKVPVFIMPDAWAPYREVDISPRGLWAKMYAGFRTAWFIATAHEILNNNIIEDPERLVAEITDTVLRKGDDR